MGDEVKKSVTIVFAEDNDDDFELACRAFKKISLVNEIVRVRDGQELVDYLKSANCQANGKIKKSNVILLDLNMPRKDGRQALEEIKADGQLKHIPVIIMTTSKAEEDVMRAYQLGGNAYIRKPIRQDEFVATLAVFKQFWLEVVELPCIKK